MVFIYLTLFVILSFQFNGSKSQTRPEEAQILTDTDMERVDNASSSPSLLRTDQNLSEQTSMSILQQQVYNAVCFTSGDKEKIIKTMHQFPVDFHAELFAAIGELPTFRSQSDKLRKQYIEIFERSLKDVQKILQRKWRWYSDQNASISPLAAKFSGEIKLFNWIFKLSSSDGFCESTKEKLFRMLLDLNFEQRAEIRTALNGVLNSVAGRVLARVISAYPIYWFLHSIEWYTWRYCGTFKADIELVRWLVAKRVIGITDVYIGHEFGWMNCFCAFRPLNETQRMHLWESISVLQSHSLEDMETVFSDKQFQVIAICYSYPSSYQFLSKICFFPSKL